MWRCVAIAIALLVCSCSGHGGHELDGGAGGNGGGGNLDMVAGGAGGNGSAAITCNANGPDTCYCVAGDSGNTTACSPAQVATPGSCCADDDWPASGSRCECDTFGCTMTNGDCNCTQNLGGPISSCTDTTCCTGISPTGIFGTCYCISGTGCTNGYTQVASCSAATITCDSGRRRVTSCR